jgi:hypothetical protein
MQTNKLRSYFGFAKKSSSIIYGFDGLKKDYKKISGVFLSCDISGNLEQKVVDFCLNKNIIYKKLEYSLDDLLNTNNCMVVAIINKNFVKPILECEE